MTIEIKYKMFCFCIVCDTVEYTVHMQGMNNNVKNESSRDTNSCALSIYFTQSQQAVLLYYEPHDGLGVLPIMGCNEVSVMCLAIQSLFNGRVVSNPSQTRKQNACENVKPKKRDLCHCM